MVDTRRHKAYRDVLTPLFSKRRVEELAIVVRKMLEKGVDILTQSHRESRPVEIQLLYRCITVSSRHRKRIEKRMRCAYTPPDGYYPEGYHWALAECHALHGGPVRRNAPLSYLVLTRLWDRSTS